jgi:flagella basal body P-ring formation protein FlgA
MDIDITVNNDFCREKGRLNGLLLWVFICLLSSVFCLLPSVSYAARQSTVEVQLINFIKQFYEDREGIQVKFNSYPSILKENASVNHINFTKIPDANGDGICTMEVTTKQGFRKNVHVSFKVFVKKHIYVLKQNLKRGDVINAGDIIKKEILLNENKGRYPLDIEEIIGKTVKKDINAGTVVKNDMIEDRYVVKTNEIVSILAQNNRIMVKTKGRAIEKGKIGDVIRVKNVSSNKEILGKVVGSGVVTVDM